MCKFLFQERIVSGIHSTDLKFPPSHAFPDSPLRAARSFIFMGCGSRRLAPMARARSEWIFSRHGIPASVDGFGRSALENSAAGF